MILNRRTAIKQFLFVSAGATLLPACFLEEDDKEPIRLKNFSIDGVQAENLAALSETIIPGAKDIFAQAFVFKMLDDCYKKEEQQKFMKGLDSFEKKAIEKHDKSFYKCSKAEQESIVKEINGNKELPAELSFFYSTTKRLTIQAYTTSKFYLTKVQVYKMVPGKYQGCVPVKNNQTTTS